MNPENDQGGKVVAFSTMAALPRLEILAQTATNPLGITDFIKDPARREAARRIYETGAREVECYTEANSMHRIGDPDTKAVISTGFARWTEGDGDGVRTTVDCLNHLRNHAEKAGVPLELVSFPGKR